MYDPDAREDSRLWIAWAPLGVPSTGPAITFVERTAQNYRDMDWRVEGPYVLEETCSMTP